MKLALEQCRKTVPYCLCCERAIKENDNSPLSRLFEITEKAIHDSMKEAFENSPIKTTIVLNELDENPAKPEELDDDIWNSTCYLVQQNKLYIDTSRELEVPEDTKKLLRLLGHFAELDVFPCKYEKHLPWITVRHHVLTILAKIDFALLERGVDMLELCKIVGLDYYDRERDIDLCGEATYLIEYYIDSIRELKSNQADGQEEDTIALPHDLEPLFAQAVANGIITNTYQIITSMADFIRLCVSMDVMSPWGRRSFRRIRNVLTDKEGLPISEIKLAQAYCDVVGKTKKGV